MTTTTDRRLYSEALADAEAFRNLFPPHTYERWTIAGSIRRRRPDVGDVEHVVIPNFGGMFGVTGNLLFDHLNSLITLGQLSKHVYTDGRNRWGEKYRGVDFRGFNHELFTAAAGNWGSVLAIRTGPAGFSRELVTRLRRHGFCNDLGYVHLLDGDKPGDVVNCPDEDTFFRLAGTAYVVPEKRVE